MTSIVHNVEKGIKLFKVYKGSEKYRSSVSLDDKLCDLVEQTLPDKTSLAQWVQEIVDKHEAGKLKDDTSAGLSRLVQRQMYNHLMQYIDRLKADQE